MIEIKSYLGRANEDIARAVAAAVAKTIFMNGPLSPPSILGSERVKEATANPRRLSPTCPFGFSGKSARFSRGTWSAPSLHRIVSARYGAGLSLAAGDPWTVNSAADLQKIVPLGVDG